LFVVKRLLLSIFNYVYLIFNRLLKSDWILFFVSFRSTQPRFQFIVMNRRNTGQDLFK
jgi:hypothetical protein